MKRCALFLFAAALFLWVPLTYAATNNSSHVKWHTNFQDALRLSQSTSRPIVLFFTGTDWCTWCNKLERESLDTADFVQATKDKLIFVKLDFPMKTKLDPDTTKQNQELQKKFSIRGYPTLILLDPKQQQIGVTGYRVGGGKQYADHLLRMVDEYTGYKLKMKNVHSKKFTGKELKRLYQKAKEIGHDEDASLIVRVGMKSNLAHFFMTEHYRFLVDRGQKDDPSTLSLKKRLLASDPNNSYLTHYQVAVIDFEDNCERMDYEGFSPNVCVGPLIAYIKRFGTTDKDNMWRLNMVISQIYLDKNKYPEALKFAEASKNTAPTNMQADIDLAINNIRKRI